MTEIAGWQPHSASHAIERVTATVLFGEEVTTTSFRKIEAAARIYSHKFQMRTEQPRLALGFDVSHPGGLLPSQFMGHDPKVMGIEFMRLERPDFYSDKLTIQRNSITLENWRYARWNGFSEQLSGICREICQLYTQSVPLAGIQLEYVDRFNADSPDSVSDVGQVVNAESEFVAKAAFKAHDPWHCHVGWFELPDATTKRLMNVDIDVADMPLFQATSEDAVTATSVHSIRIRTYLADFFKYDDSEDALEDIAAPDSMAKRFDSLHIESKGMLKQVLTRNAANSISLEG